MPKYEITLPDGKTYEVESPTKLTDAQAYAAVKSQISSGSTQETGRGGVLPSLAEGFVTSFTGIPLGIAGLYSATPEETALGKFSTGAEKVVQDVLGIDPTKEATTAEAVAGGLGSLASFLVPGTLAAKGVRAAGAGAAAARGAGMVAAGAQAVPLGASEQVQRRMAEEAATGAVTSEEDRLASQRLGAAIGLSELVPLRRFIGPLEEILTKVPLSKAGGAARVVENGVKRALGAATEEGAQEALAQTAQNLVEQGYYNPDLDVTEGLLSSAGVGGAAGGTLDVILQLMAGRKASKMRTAFTQLERENARQAAEKEPERIRAEALAGREELLKAAPTGEISIKSASDSNRPNYYKVVNAAGETKAEFNSKDAAFLAAEQYELDNPGTVKFIRPTIAETARAKKGKKKRIAPVEAQAPIVPDESREVPVPEAPKTLQIQREALESGRRKAMLYQASDAKPEATSANIKRITFKDGRVVDYNPKLISANKIRSAMKTDRLNEVLDLGPFNKQEVLTSSAAGADRVSIVERTPDGTEAKAAEGTTETAPSQIAAMEATKLAPENQVNVEPREKGLAERIAATSPAAPATPPAAPPAAVQAQPAAKPPKEYKPSVRALFKPVATTPEGAQKLRNFEANKEAVAKALNARLSPIVGNKVRIQLDEVVRQGKGIAEGATSAAGDVIYLSYNIYDPNLTTDQMVDKLFDVMNHEVIHSLSDLGLFRGNELPTLFKAAERIKYQGNQFTYYDRAVRMYATVEGYRNPDGSLKEEMIREEAVAEMFRDARAGKLKLEGTPKGVFGRIVEFFKRLFNGYRDARVGQIFKDIEAGKMGAREARAVEGGVRKLSAVPQDISKEADRAFKKLAGDQRGAPELLMVEAQNALRGYESGPALTYAMEHVGDLTHRMGQYGNEYPSYEFGIEFVAPKVRTGLRVVTNRVDAERIAKLPDDPTLKKYADAHSKLKVYNEAQRAARDAAVALGRKDLKEAERNLLILQEMIDNETYVEIAGSYDPNYEDTRLLGIRPRSKSRAEGGVRKLSALPENERTKIRLARREETLAKAKQVVDSFYEEFPPHPFNRNQLAFQVDDSEGFVVLELEPEIYTEQGRKTEGVVHVKWLQAYPMRSGLGRKGMELIQERAREAGVAITLEPYEKGVVGLAGLNKFYKKMGFRPRVKGDNRHLIWRPEEQAEGGVRKFSIPAQLTGESEQEFARWWKRSKAVNEDGSPMVYYRGDPQPLEGGELRTGLTSGGIRGEEGPFFFTRSKRFAGDFALSNQSRGGGGYSTETGVMTPVYLSVQNPWDFDNPAHVKAVVEEVRKNAASDPVLSFLGKSDLNKAMNVLSRGLEDGSWSAIEKRMTQRAIRNLGFDGFYLREAGNKNLAVYKPQQAKSIFNQFEPGTAESRKLSVIPPYPDDTTSTVYIREAGPAARLKPSGKVTVGEIAKAFDAITGKSDITDPADYNRIVDAIVKEVEYQKQQAQSGVGWYDNDVDLVFKILSETFPQFSDPFYGAQNRQLFTIIAGVMSNGMKARPNVTMAAINFANYMNTGKFSEIHPFTGKGWNQRTNIMSGQIRMLNSMMADPMFNVPAGSNMTREEKFLEWVFSEHPVREINQMRAKHGVKSPAKIGGVDTMRLGAYAFGPKFGPFILNLNGRTDETVDSWASRSFYRHMGRLLAKNGTKTNDAPLTGTDREAMKRALRDIADKTNLSSRDVQAVLWFYEKALYNDLGMKIPLEVFSDGARDYVNQFGKGKANDPTADDRTRAIARAGEEARTRTTAPTPDGVAESKAVAPELKIANGIAEAAARTGEASQAEADIANQAVRDAVRKLSTVPEPVPMPPNMEAANKKIFSATHVPTTPGEKFMAVLGGFGNREGIGKLADMFRVYFVQKSGQISKKEREAYLSGAIDPDESNYAEMSATAAIDMMQRSSHYTVEAAYNGAPVIRGLNAKREAVLLRDGGDPNSSYMFIEKDQADSPIKILEMIITGGPNGGDLTEQFRSYALAQVSKRRLAEGKEIPEDITPEYIEAAEALAEQYPIIKQAFESYQRFNTKLLEAVRDSGYLSQELFEEFTDQQNYYSMYRQLEEGDVVQELSGGLASRIRFKAYEGSTTGNLMADPIVAMMHNVAFWNNVILRTIATQKAYRVGVETGVVKRLRAFEDEDGDVTIETPKRAEGYDDKVFYTYINGVEVPFASKDPLFTIGLSGNDFVSPGTFLELAGMPADFLREMVTRDPSFMVANLMRDSVSTWVLAGAGANPFQTFKGFVSALNSSSSFEALRSYGVVGSFDEAQKPMAKIVGGMRQKFTNVQGLTNLTSVGSAAWNKLGSWSEASDAATRIAVYEAAKKDGASDFTAAYRALSIMNFSRSGHSAGLRVMTRMVPFLNARIQGFDVLYTGLKAATGVLTGRDQLAFDRQRGTHVLVRGMALTAAAMALSLMLEDDEDYQQLPQYIKDANILIPIPGQQGKYFQIPKPFEAGFLFMTVPQAFYDVAMDNRSMRSATKLMFNQFSSTFGFNPIPQAALPMFENLINRDFYTGQPLISAGMEKLDPSLQYNASTSYVARGLSQLSGFLPLNYDFEEGRFVPISPIMLDNLISGYGGPIISYIAMGLGGVTYAFGNDNQGLPVAGSQLPVIRRFFVDARDRQPQAATEAYELYQLVDKTNRTIARLKRMGDAEALKEYREENINILRVGKQVRRMTDNLNNIRAQMRRLEADKVTPMNEKLEKMRELRAREARVTSKIDEINQMLGR